MIIADDLLGYNLGSSSVLECTARSVVPQRQWVIQGKFQVGDGGIVLLSGSLSCLRRPRRPELGLILLTGQVIRGSVGFYFKVSET